MKWLASLVFIVLVLSAGTVLADPPDQNPNGSPGIGNPNGTPPPPSQSGSVGSQPPAPQVPAPPTFMNGILPGSGNSLNNQEGMVPAGFGGALMTNMINQGVPAEAAPLLSSVFSPFGMRLIQPNPFMVTPQGLLAFTGSEEFDTNLNDSSNNPEIGFRRDLAPSAAYTTFDDTGYLSGLYSPSWVTYDKANIQSEFNQIADLQAGSYLGQHVFAGVSDSFIRTDTPTSGTSLGLLNGRNAFMINTLNAELAFSITPTITLVTNASDFYFDSSGGATVNPDGTISTLGGSLIGFSNVQTLGEDIWYRNDVNALTLSYDYTQGFYSLFPGFHSSTYGLNGTRSISPVVTIGIKGSYSPYDYGSQTLNFNQYSGAFTISDIPNTYSAYSLEAGWNGVQFQSGQTFQSPLVDLNVMYSGAVWMVDFNAGQYLRQSFAEGIAMGPLQADSAELFFLYNFTPLVYFVSEGSFGVYDYLEGVNFLQGSSLLAGTNFTPGSNFVSHFIMQSDGLFWRARQWLLTGFEYTLENTDSNIPGVGFINNRFIALVSLQYWFHR